MKPDRCFYLQAFFLSLSMNKKLIKFFKISVIVLAIMYIGICTLLYLNQDDLLFHPKPKTLEDVSKILEAAPEFDTLTFVMNDSNRTCGYISKDTIRR